MLVREMIEAIENKELKVMELANRYEVSDRTIQAKIKKLGFVWESQDKKYKFTGADDYVFNLHIDDVFKSTPRLNMDSNKAVKEKDGTIPLIIHTESDIESKDASNTKMKKAVVEFGDSIDKLLSGKKEKKIYRGFYFDSDVLSVLDTVDNGVKSELINECLRKVFKEKNLL